MAARGKLGQVFSPASTRWHLQAGPGPAGAPSLSPWKTGDSPVTLVTERRVRGKPRIVHRAAQLPSPARERFWQLTFPQDLPHPSCTGNIARGGLGRLGLKEQCGKRELLVRVF